VTIRAGAASDRDAAVDVWTAALEARDGQSQGSEVRARARAKFERDWVRFAVVGTDPVAFALTVDGGSMGGAPGHPGAGTRRLAVLELLAVAPGSARQGLGRSLLVDAIRAATELGYSAIELQVRASNIRAQNLYAAAGFEPHGEPAPHPLGGAPMIEYRRELL
jgi:ribosomal protein S18 acetylase RimI-like enzyme